MAGIQLGVEVSKGGNRGIEARHRQVVDHKLRGEASEQVVLAEMLPGTAVLTGGNHGIGAKRQVEVRKVRSEASGQALEKSR